METTEHISVDVIGQRTGKPFNGKFTIQMVLSRRDQFAADERRRQIIGSNPLGVSPALGGEAYMLGQLFVRISSGPDWWLKSDSGLDIEDENVIGELYRLIETKVKEFEGKLIDSSKKSLEKMAKQTKTISTAPAENQE